MTLTLSIFFPTTSEDPVSEIKYFVDEIMTAVVNSEM